MTSCWDAFCYDTMDNLQKTCVFQDLYLIQIILALFSQIIEDLHNLNISQACIQPWVRVETRQPLPKGCVQQEHWAWTEVNC